MQLSGNQQNGAKILGRTRPNHFALGGLFRGIVRKLRVKDIKAVQDVFSTE